MDLQYGEIVIDLSSFNITRRYIRVSTDGNIFQSDDYDVPLNEWEKCEMVE